MTNGITIICGTNRKDAVSLHITYLYQQILERLEVPSRVLALHTLPPDFAFSALYDNYGKNKAFNEFVEVMLNTPKYVFVVPEYNGSFPGALKTFIDGLEYPNTFKNKKAALVGLASSGHGSSLALSHLTDIFNFCGMHVLAYKPRLENIGQHFTDSALTNARYVEMLEKQAKMLVAF